MHTLLTMLYAKGILGAVEIVDALTSAAATPEDLAAAIAYLKDRCLSGAQFHSITDHFERQAAAHGLSRGLHNQLAYCMMDGMSLEFRVRLVGSIIPFFWQKVILWWCLIIFYTH